MRTVPITLQEHFDSGATTKTLLMRIDPVTPGYASIGCTLLDQDVLYDDGDIEINYKAPIGMIPASLQTSNGMDVDNTKIQHLVPEVDMGLSEQDIVSGAYDFAKFRLYVVNYADLSMWHVELSRGTLGQMRIENGVSFWSELTSLSKQLKTNIVQKDSLTCRATFGSNYPGSSSGTVFERFPCGFDAETLYIGGTVTAVGAESNRTFTAGGWVAAADAYVPGMVRWVTGRNAGQEREVEGQDAVGVIDLAFQTMFPVEVGDTFLIRPDCAKWKDGANGCKTFFGVDWVLHYRGEPYIPISDADAILTPGATVGRGFG